MSWEYKIDSIATGTVLNTGEVDASFVNERLNDMASHGWELVTSYPTTYGHGGTRLLLFIYKRLVDIPDTP